MNQIKALEQSVIEGRYARKNIREKVLLKINLAVGGELLNPFRIACANLNEYLASTPPYKSKQIRINHVNELIHDKKVSVIDIVTEVILVVFQVEGISTIQSVCGQLSHLFQFEDIFDGIKTAAEILAVICESDLYDIIPAQDSETGSLLVESNYSLDEETKQYIAGTKYLPPMVCKPQYIQTNRDNAYLTISESFILGASNHHNEEINLTNLNLANSFALSLDENILQYEEESSKPLDTEEKKVNFERIRRGSREVYEELLDNGNQFYNTHKYCKRGREYTQGYHVHIQSTSYKKALINLHKKEVISL